MTIRTFVPESPRGYAAVALDNPKYDGNIGGALRAAYCLDANMVVLSGTRFRREATDTIHAWKHIPTHQVSDVFDALPVDCTPVAVDLVEGATPLPRFQHPERAFYIFGAEDRTLGEPILARCKHRVVIPTRLCLNLACAINVVLYDRIVKRHAWRTAA